MITQTVLCVNGMWNVSIMHKLNFDLCTHSVQCGVLVLGGGFPCLDVIGFSRPAPLLGDY